MRRLLIVSLILSGCSYSHSITFGRPQAQDAEARAMIMNQAQILNDLAGQIDKSIDEKIATALKAKPAPKSNY